MLAAGRSHCGMSVQLPGWQPEEQDRSPRPDGRVVVSPCCYLIAVQCAQMIQFPHASLRAAQRRFERLTNRRREATTPDCPPPRVKVVTSGSTAVLFTFILTCLCSSNSVCNSTSATT